MPIQDHEENVFFTMENSQKYLKATTFKMPTHVHKNRDAYSNIVY